MKIDIIVPVYRNLDLVIQCLSSLRQNLREIEAYEPRLIVIDDSPDDKVVSDYLKEMERIGTVDLLVTNSANLGFVKSVNKGLSLASERKAAAILVNSDTVTFENTLRELVAVAQLDEQFGFVSPRSNNASICTFPWLPHNRAGNTLTPEQCRQVWADVANYMPRYTIAPTAIGFYMFINPVVVANFGRLDERFGAGYEEENDLVMRAGKVGFRAVLANHSFAYHAGEASFSLSELDLTEHREANLRKIVQIHPEFLPLIRKYENSPLFRSERALSGLVPDETGKIDLAFNLLGLAPVFNGTNEFAVSVIKTLNLIGSEKFNYYVLCSRQSAAFHGFDELRNVRCRSMLDRRFGVTMSFGQPYDLHDVNVMEALAPINVYSMLDTISLDCSSLRVEQDIEDLWDYVAETANGLVFISDFSRDTFLRRFKVRGGRTFARLLPTKLREYETRYRGAPSASRHIFIAGNHFHHKDSSRTAAYLARRFPTLQFVTMGMGESFPPNVTCLRSGDVEDRHMIDILASSSVIVLPSYYEGFGFSLLHALSLRKPVVARDIPATREILRKFSSTTGVYLYSHDSELESAVLTAVSANESAVTEDLGDDWNTWTRQLLSFLEQLINEPSTAHELLIKRIRGGDVLRKLRINGSSTAAGEPAPVHLELEELSLGTNEEFVLASYRHVLGREPDEGGFVHHVESLAKGMSRADLVQALLESEEFRNSNRRVHVVGLQPSGQRRRLISRLFRW